MARYTKRDADGRYYIESANGKLESNIKGHTYGEAIDRFAELENADVAPMAEVARGFAKFLIDKSVDGCISICDLPDLVCEFSERADK